MHRRRSQETHEPLPFNSLFMPPAPVWAGRAGLTNIDGLAGLARLDDRKNDLHRVARPDDVMAFERNIVAPRLVEHVELGITLQHRGRHLDLVAAVVVVEIEAVLRLAQ